MRSRIKCLYLYFIFGIFLFNLYAISRFFGEQEKFKHHLFDRQQHFRLFYDVNFVKNSNEFLILDWTGKQHIFRENDPIKCDFSHVDLKFCQSKFDSIINSTLRSNLIERCNRLAKLTVHWTTEQSLLKQADLIAYHSIHIRVNDLPELIRNDEQQQFSTVYILESEVHSLNSNYWDRFDFPVWYNLERSYPEPATYFDVKLYLDQLFAPTRVPFSRKTTTAPIAWLISNCNAYNGRSAFVKELMSYIRVDSYGHCLNNIKSKTVTQRRESNSVLYSSYKFVLAIENSNCEDYVTEKLIDAIGSTSIPIVASRNGKPDYARFAPKYSYINVYDFKSVKDLADHLNHLSTNQTAYDEYLWFRRLPINKYAISGFITRSLNENLRLADQIVGKSATMRKWLLNKETSVNKYCKLAQFIYTNHWESIYNRKKSNRPTADEVCLPKNDLVSYFHL
ncbi:unnamed protein product [Rotaria magnacalcarata]|uniref:Fucosyltransferase n=2 Tax=Rotaria magnacalcarata TaxID=392030 RepID=A0A816YWS3_9BILA|nr:unnamed protein product [Rotaria magnacalcarata]CAF2176386.1 unnamed protein product [Rotaria magnacalcarata]